MELPAIITLLALAEYMYFGFQVGAARAKYDVPAPATSGSPEWERLNRVHLNTLEQLVVFLPALWLFAYYLNATVSAGLGALFLIGRILYYRAYTTDPGSRTLGFAMGYLATAALLLGGIVGAIKSLID